MQNSLPNFIDDGARPDPLQQLFEAQMQEGSTMDMSMDFREGSPCRQAASELLLPGSFGADGQNLMAGSISPTPSLGAPPQMGTFPKAPPTAFQPTHPGSHYGQHPLYQPWGPLKGQPGFLPMYNQTPCVQPRPQPAPAVTPLPMPGCLHPAEVPAFPWKGFPDLRHLEAQQQKQGLAEQNYLTAMMQQAQSVGVWGGSDRQNGGQVAHPIKDTSTNIPLKLEPGPCSLGLLENGAHQAQHPQNQQQNPIQFYQAEMNSMLPPANMKVNGLGMQPYQGVGQISREHQLQSQQAPISKSLPRFQPVSLGMTTDTLSQILSQSQRHGMNDGPFRPPTKQPPRKAGVSGSLFPQSKMQLDLGLASGSPINLVSWSYADESPSTGVTCVGSGPPDLNVEKHRASESSAQPSLSAEAACMSHPCSSTGGRHQAKELARRRADLEPSIRSCKSLESIEPRSRTDDFSRAECLQRYQDKKRRRHLYKTIRYHKRKVNADNRPRHKGRFVKSSEQSKSEETLEKAAEEVSDTKEKPMSMATVAASIGDDITQPKAEPEDNIPKDTSVEYPSMGKA